MQLPGSHPVDTASSYGFLFDTGSDLCCFSRNLLKVQCAATNYIISAANSSTINTYANLPEVASGVRIAFRHCGRRLAHNRCEFLAIFEMLPDCRSGHLLDGTTGCAVSGNAERSPKPSVNVLSTCSPYQELLCRFPGLTRPFSAPRTSVTPPFTKSGLHQGPNLLQMTTPGTGATPYHAGRVQGHDDILIHSASQEEHSSLCPDVSLLESS